MKASIGRFKHNFKKSLSGIRLALSNYKYILLAILFSFVVSLIIYFSINASFFWPLLTSALPLPDKLAALGLLTQSVTSGYFKDLNGLLLLILSVLQGTSLSLLIYNFKNSNRVDAKAVTGSGLAAIAAIIGLGCVSCGTSILIPIMTLIFSSSSYLFLDAANLIILILATGLSVYSLYKIGLIIHVNQLTKKWQEEAKQNEKK